MNLLSQPGLAREKSFSDALMIRIQPAKSGRSIASDVEACDSQRKAVQNKSQGCEGLKTLYWSEVASLNRRRSLRERRASHRPKIHTIPPWLV